MKESSGIIYLRCSNYEETYRNLSKTSLSAGTLIVNNLPMQRLHKAYRGVPVGLFLPVPVPVPVLIFIVTKYRLVSVLHRHFVAGQLRAVSLAGGSVGV